MQPAKLEAQRIRGGKAFKRGDLGFDRLNLGLEDDDSVENADDMTPIMMVRAMSRLFQRSRIPSATEVAKAIAPQMIPCQ